MPAPALGFCPEWDRLPSQRELFLQRPPERTVGAQVAHSGRAAGQRTTERQYSIGMQLPENQGITMTKEMWINLPVKDINRSRAFFTALGFSFNEQHSNAELASLVIGDKHLAVNLFKDSTFEKFTKNKIADASQATEVLFSIGAESREEVDEILRKAVSAGGKVFSESQEKDGWMYGCGFADLDGHRWNALYMDVSKVPKK
jgi:predicted lactoylglutathione lyase